jgi:hypothetical protein
LTTNWFYARDGRTYGPVSGTEIKRLAASGQLQPHDLLWPDSADRSRAVVACTAVPFSAGNLAPEDQPAAGPPAKTASAPEPAPGVPVAVALAVPVPVALPVLVAQPLLPPPPAPPVPPTRDSGAAPLPDALTPSRTDQPPDETGLDAQTGRILDPARFARWQRDQARKRQEELAARPTTTLPEVYLQGKRELERWIDRDDNRDRILAADLDAIGRDRELLDVLEAYRCWGPALVEKLRQHLTFLLDNRRRFYATGQGGVGGTCSGSVK